MALRIAGIKYVIKGAGSALSTMAKLSKAERRMGFWADNSGRQVSNFGRQTKNATKDLGLAVAVGTTAANVFNTLSNALGSLVGSAFSGAASMQTLEVQLESLIAKQERQADSTLSTADALGIATERTQEYFHWLRQVALQSPFEFEDISRTFAIAQAYQFTAEQARSLTLAITEFAAWAGKTSEVQIRIVENFGQMLAQGKVTMTELRDLGRGAGLPINLILERMADNLGIVTDDMHAFRKEVSSGAVDVNEFFKAFIEMSQEDFAGASKRMLNTWEGVKSQAEDFVKVILGMDALGPLLDKIIFKLRGFISTLIGSKSQMNAQVWGQALAQAFEGITSGLNNAIRAVKAIGRELGFTFPTLQEWAALFSLAADMIEDGLNEIRNLLRRNGEAIVDELNSWIDVALEYGGKFITGFAEGMITAAGAALTWAMETISGFLEYWMNPQSPPRIAPDLDIWGSDAMLEYLKGFSKADFSTLKSVQAPLKKAFSSLVKLDLIGADEATKAFIGITEGLTEALGSAGIPDLSFLDQIPAGAGRLGEELKTLIHRQIALADATKALQTAEENLEKSRDAAKDAGIKVRKLTKEYNDLVRAGADPALLETKLAEVNAAEHAETTALENVKLADEQVELEKEKIDPLKDQVDLQKQLIDQMLQMVDIQKQFAVAAGAAGAGGGGRPEPTEFPLPDPISVSGFDPTTRLDELKDEIKKKFEEWWEEIKTTFDQSGIADLWTETFGEGSDFQVAMKELKTSMEQSNWETIWGNIKEAWFTSGTNAWLNKWFGEGGIIPSLFTSEFWAEYRDFISADLEEEFGIAPLAETFEKWFGEGGVFPTIATTDFWEGFWETFVADMNLAADDVENFADNAVYNLGRAIHNFLVLAGTIPVQFVKNVKLIFQANLAFFKLVLTRARDGFIALVRGVLMTLGAIVKVNLDKLQLWWESFKTRALEVWDNLTAGLTEGWNSFKETLILAWETTVESFKTLFGGLGEYVSDLLFNEETGLVALFGKLKDSLFTVAGNVIQGFLDGLKAKWVEVTNWFSGVMDAVPEPIKKIFGIDSPSKLFMGFGQDIMEGLKIGIEQKSPEVQSSTEQAALDAASVLFALKNSMMSPTVTNNNVTTNINMGQYKDDMLEMARIKILLNNYVKEALQSG